MYFQLKFRLYYYTTILYLKKKILLKYLFKNLIRSENNFVDYQIRNLMMSKKFCHFSNQFERNYLF